GVRGATAVAEDQQLAAPVEAGGHGVTGPGNVFRALDEGQPGLDPPVELPDCGRHRTDRRNAATPDGRGRGVVGGASSSPDSAHFDWARACRQRYRSMARCVSASASTADWSCSSPAGVRRYIRRAGPVEEVSK